MFGSLTKQQHDAISTKKCDPIYRTAVDDEGMCESSGCVPSFCFYISSRKLDLPKLVVTCRKDPWIVWIYIFSRCFLLYMICPWSSPNIRFVFSAVYRHSIPATIKYNVYTTEILLSTKTAFNGPFI